jgi:hypothetical protein
VKYLATIAISAAGAYAVVRWMGEWITDLLQQLDDGIGSI